MKVTKDEHVCSFRDVSPSKLASTPLALRNHRMQRNGSLKEIRTPPRIRLRAPVTPLRYRRLAASPRIDMQSSSSSSSLPFPLPGLVHSSPRAKSRDSWTDDDEEEEEKRKKKVTIVSPRIRSPGFLRARFPVRRRKSKSGVQESKKEEEPVWSTTTTEKGEGGGEENEGKEGKEGNESPETRLLQLERHLDQKEIEELWKRETIDRYSPQSI